MKNETLLSRHAFRMRGSLTLLLAVWLHAGLYAQPNTWAQMANYGGGDRADAVSFSIGTKGYLGTGVSSTAYMNDFWEYDPATNTWSQKANVGGVGRSGAVGFSIGSKGYIGTGEVGIGVFARDLWEYDPATNAWTQKADLGGTARHRAVGFSIGSKGYIGTGNDGNHRSDFWEYDPTLNTWTQRAALTATGRSGAVSFQLGNKGYIGTGFDGGYKKDLWEFDPVVNSWTQKADMPVSGRWRGVGSGIGNKGYIGLGSNGTSGSFGTTLTLAEDFWEYTAATNSWSEMSFPNIYPILDATAFTIGNFAYVGTGGRSAFLDDSIWRYTPFDGSINCSVTGSICTLQVSTLTVSYTATGTFNSGNQFVALLSDANGSFATFNPIGAAFSTTSGTISCTVPPGLPAGSGYRVRVMSTVPAYIGSDNGVNIPAASGAVVTCPSNLVHCIPSGLLALNTLPGVSPPSTNSASSFSGSGVIVVNAALGLYQFDPSIAGLGNHTITYTNTSGACPGSCSFIITVNPATSEGTQTITACGSFTWPLTGQVFNTTGIYQVPGLFPCTYITLDLTILDPPTVTCPEAQTVCLTDDVIFLETLPGLSPFMYAETNFFTGPGVVPDTPELGLYNFDPMLAGVGTHAITYTYFDGTCVSTCAFNITVVPESSNTTTIVSCADYTWPVNGQTYGATGIYTTLSGCITEVLDLTMVGPPIVSCPADLVICNSFSSTFLESIEGLDPPSVDASSLFAGPGVIAVDPGAGLWDFRPNIAGVGTHTITYFYISGGCMSSCSFQITVQPSTNDTISIATCESYTWLETGITYFDSGLYPVDLGCDEVVLDLTILPPQEPSCPADLSVCSTVEALFLEELPGLSPPSNSAASSFSGPGVVVSGASQGLWDFVTAYAGVGTHTITYTYDNGGCSSSCTFDITVVPSTFNTTTISACGSYTWAVTGETYTASGNYQTTTNNCIAEVLALTIVPAPVLSCPADLSVCSTEEVLLLEELPGLSPPSIGVASSFSGPGVSEWDASQGQWDFYVGTAGVGTHTITYTYDDGACPGSCTFDITVIPGSSDTTTTTACDSYTWAVTGETYTASGNYQTTTNNCISEVLALTIVAAPVLSCPADFNVCSTVNALFLEELPGLSPPSNSAASSFSGPGVSVWDASQGQWDFYVGTAGVGTHTITYTYDNGACPGSCTFEITVDPVITDTTTVTVCGSYSWAVTGQNYTNSGFYLAGGGCTLFVLDLTILGEAECDPCPLAEDGIANFDESTCACELGYFATITNIGGNDVITACTICPPGSFCPDGVEQFQCAVGTFSDQPGQTACTPCAPGFASASIGLTTCTACPPGAFSDIVGAVACSLCPTNTYNPLSAQTECLACPSGETSGVGSTECEAAGPCNDVVLEFQTDANPGQTTWEIRDSNEALVAIGGPLVAPNGTQTELACLPNGCYSLRVLDSAGDGIINGGYTLRVAGSVALDTRIIDNFRNFTSGTLSAIGNGPNTFCFPMSTQKPIYVARDKEDWVEFEYLVAEPDADVSAQWLVGDQTLSGYQFWFFDPNGSYSFRRNRNHATSDGFGPANEFRACHMKINNWALANRIPENVLMNVRIRARVAGTYKAFGPAYRFKIDPVRAACPLTKLNDIPNQQYESCNQTRNFGPGNWVHARQVSGANRYQFRFRLPAENFSRSVTANTYFLQLNWGTLPLEAGKTYNVDVRVSKDGGATWCTSGPLWGQNCTLTIGSGAQAGEQNLGLGNITNGNLAMWPNPNRGDQLWMDLNGIEAGVQTVSVDIFDMTGKQIVARIIPTQGDRLNTVLNLNGDLATGMYLVNITAGEKRFTERLVIAQ